MLLDVIFKSGVMQNVHRSATKFLKIFVSAHYFDFHGISKYNFQNSRRAEVICRQFSYKYLLIFFLRPI